MWTRGVILLGLVFFLSAVGTVWGATIDVFALATSNGADCQNPPGPCGALMSLPIVLKADSMLIVTFSARGIVTPSSTQTVEVQINCEVDGVACEPDANGVQFLYPTFCCDTRSFTWTLPVVSKGAHTVRINWATLNSGTASIQNRTLYVQAAAK
jgi:hypothetical protein